MHTRASARTHLDNNNAGIYKQAHNIATSHALNGKASHGSPTRPCQMHVRYSITGSKNKHICTPARAHAHTHTHTHPRAHPNTCTYTHIPPNTYTHIYTHTLTHTHTHTHTHTPTLTHQHSHTNTHTHTPTKGQVG